MVERMLNSISRKAWQLRWTWSMLVGPWCCAQHGGRWEGGRELRLDVELGCNPQYSLSVPSPETIAPSFHMSWVSAYQMMSWKTLETYAYMALKVFTIESVPTGKLFKLPTLVSASVK